MSGTLIFDSDEALVTKAGNFTATDGRSSSIGIAIDCIRDESNRTIGQSKIAATSVLANETVIVVPVALASDQASSL